MTVHVGTSGWQYRDWRGPVYPGGVAQARWLEHYAQRFSTVESNAAFYRLPERRTVEAWGGAGGATRVGGGGGGAAPRFPQGRKGEPLPHAHPPPPRARGARRDARPARGRP